jgi:hypothetical protein
MLRGLGRTSTYVVEGVEQENYVDDHEQLLLYTTRTAIKSNTVYRPSSYSSSTVVVLVKQTIHTTMKTAAACLLALAASASAFTSTQVPSRAATAVPAAMDDMVGSVDFRGQEFKWDPVRSALPLSCPPFV